MPWNSSSELVSDLFPAYFQVKVFKGQFCEGERTRFAPKNLPRVATLIRNTHKNALACSKYIQLCLFYHERDMGMNVRLV